MKINRAYAGEKRKLKSNRHGKSESASEVNFNSILETKIETDNQFTIEQLLDSIDKQAKRFIDNQTLVELNNYKETIKEILTYISKNGMESEVLRRRRSSRKADFLIIKEIDKKLLELSKHITGQNNKAFNLLKQMEEIRGLVFDLVY